MNDIRFTWDNEKNQTNTKKHYVSFEEARTVFYDVNALLISDPNHSDDEERFILLGHSKNMRTLVVCHCYRESDSIIRIISARKATANEKKMYGEQI